MRDRPHPNHRLEWPGGIVPEWARPQQGKNRRAKGGKGGAASKRERLQKVMAQSGYGSRRNIEILIAQGHVTVNGQAAKLGDSVGPGDKVKLDGHLIRLRFGEPLPRVLLYHKPEGEIVTRDDPEGRATVFEKLPKVNGGRWVSVGRLDINTGGLLIFTTSGELANRLTHPRFEVEREYAVRLLGELTEEPKAKLLSGVDIEGDLCKFDSIEDRGGEGSNHWYHVVLREGKNREVRRMCEAIGLTVSRLMRVRFGSVELPTFLKRGMMKELDETQVQELLAFAGMNEPLEPPQGEVPEEDEHDNIGNRIDYHANRPAREPREVDGNRDTAGNRDRTREMPIHDNIGNVGSRDNVGNRGEGMRAEPDGNRGGYGAPAQRPPKGPRRPQGGGKPAGFKKRGPGGHGQQHAQSQGQQPPHHQRKHGKGPGPGQGQGQGQSQGQGQGHAPVPGAAPGSGKPGRHRRNKNRSRNRNAHGGGEQQPVTNGNREPG